MYKCLIITNEEPICFNMHAKMQIFNDEYVYLGLIVTVLGLELHNALF